MIVKNDLILQAILIKACRQDFELCPKVNNVEFFNS